MWLLGGADPRIEKLNPAEGLTCCLQEGCRACGGRTAGGMQGSMEVRAGQAMERIVRTPWGQICATRARGGKGLEETHERQQPRAGLAGAPPAQAHVTHAMGVIADPVLNAPGPRFTCINVVNIVVK